MTVLAGQLSPLGVATRRKAKGDPDALAFIAAAGLTDSTQKAAVDALVVALKADGIWTKLRAIYPFVGGTAEKHKWNLKDPRDLNAAYRLTFAGGWTHSATGAKGNGTTGYADTHFVPSTDFNTVGGECDDACMAVYSRESTNNLGNCYDMGASNGGDGIWAGVITNYINGLAYFGVGTNSYTCNQPSPAPKGQGLYAANRAAGQSTRGYVNGMLLIEPVYDYHVPPPYSLFVGASNRGGSMAYPSPKEQALALIGDGLTQAQHTALYAAVQTFQTTLGRQV